MSERHLTQREISQKYERFARWYDWVEGVPEVLGVNRLRQRVMQRASGKVLEVAIGTGKNLAHYQSGSRIIGRDTSAEMLTIALKRASRLQLDFPSLWPMLKLCHLRMRRSTPWFPHCRRAPSRIRWRR